MLEAGESRTLFKYYISRSLSIFRYSGTHKTTEKERKPLFVFAAVIEQKVLPNFPWDGSIIVYPEN